MAPTFAKPLKFAYKDLQKRGIIIDSEVPPLSRGKTKFLISMEALGKFQIEAKIAGVSVGKMEIELEELLEKKENREDKLELEQVTLNVAQTVMLLKKTLVLSSSSKRSVSLSRFVNLSLAFSE